MEKNIRVSDGSILRGWSLSDVKPFLDGIKCEDISQNLRSEFPRTEKQVIEFIEKSCSKKEVQDFAIVKEEKLAGGISFIIHENLTIELSCLWIAELYRGKRTAQYVIEALIQYIECEYPLFTILGQVYEFNDKEKCMVEDIGFKKIDSRFVPYGDGTTCLYLYQYCHKLIV